MENWKVRLADMLVGSRHNFTLREELEDFIEQLLEEKEKEAREEGRNEVLKDRVCKKCGHGEMRHYWNGAGNSEYSGFSHCKVDGCDCVYDESNFI
jgi:hypothetical protein